MTVRQVLGIILSALASVATAVAVILGIKVRERGEVIEGQAEVIDRMERTQEYAVRSDIEARKIKESADEKVCSMRSADDPVSASLDVLRDLKGGSGSRVRPDNG